MNGRKKSELKLWRGASGRLKGMLKIMVRSPGTFLGYRKHAVCAVLPDMQSTPCTGAPCWEDALAIYPSSPLTLRKACPRHSSAVQRRVRSTCRQTRQRSRASSTSSKYASGSGSSEGGFMIEGLRCLMNSVMRHPSGLSRGTVQLKVRSVRESLALVLLRNGAHMATSVAAYSL